VLSRLAESLSRKQASMFADNTAILEHVRLNQTLRCRSKEIRRLISLVRRCGENLIRGYESIK